MRKLILKKGSGEKIKKAFDSKNGNFFTKVRINSPKKISTRFEEIPQLQRKGKEQEKELTIVKKEKIPKKEEKKVEVKVIKEKKKIKVVMGDERLTRTWLTQSESEFRDRLTRLNEQRTKRLESSVPVAVEAPRMRATTNLPTARVSPEKTAEDDSKYSISNPNQTEKKYFTENSPTFYSAGKVDEMRIGLEKNEFRQDTFARKSEGDLGRTTRFDSYVTPQRTDTTSLGRKDPMKRDEPAYRAKLPSS